MLSIFGHSRSPLCDGITRRDTLRLGALTLGGLTLPELLRAEQVAGIRKSHKAVIMIYMCGAPGHQDMYDLKMDAPAEIRGEFQPIPTNVPGIEICEHMPRMAAIMDKCVPLRSMYGSPDGDHDSFICYTGRSKRNQPAGGWPSMGSVTSRMLGATNKAVPPFVGLSPVLLYRSDLRRVAKFFAPSRYRGLKLVNEGENWYAENAESRLVLQTDDGRWPDTNVIFSRKPKRVARFTISAEQLRSLCAAYGSMTPGEDTPLEFRVPLDGSNVIAIKSGNAIEARLMAMGEDAEEKLIVVEPAFEPEAEIESP